MSCLKKNNYFKSSISLLSAHLDLKKIIFLIAVLFIGTNLQAQTYKAVVKIKESKLETNGNVTLVLYHLPDSNIIAQKIISATGFFDVKKDHHYLLKATSVNIIPYQTEFTAKDSITSLDILLEEQPKELSGVTVVARKPLITEEDDKTIVDASALTISSTNAFEVLEKTPGTIIDQDGNIYLTSMNPATVLINGREMKLSSADLSSLLKSLPANSISKVEIMRNPSAKYDAASSGGVLNIILKKGVKLGNNGSVNVAYFQGVYATETAGFTFNKTGSKVNSYISYQFTDRTNYETLNSDRTFANDSTLVQQQSFTKYPSVTHYVNTGLDYAFAKKWNIAYDLRYTATSNKNTSNNSVDFSKQPADIDLGENGSSAQNNNHSSYLSNLITLRCKIDTSGSDWTNTIEYNYFNFHNSQYYSNYYLLPPHPTLSGDGNNHNEKKNFSFQSDLVLKLPFKYTFETGIKVSNSNSQNEAVYFIDTGNALRIPDRFQTNTFQYNETISAAYLQVSKTFLGFTLKPGLRFEATRMQGHQIIPKDTTFSINRKDWFPYIFLKHKLFKIFNQTLMASAIFRKSIKRPYYESLNPYPKYIDPYLYEVGNPALRPQLTTNYEINVTFNDIPVVAIGLNQTKDIFSSVIYQDDVTKIAFRTFDNLGKNKEFYCRLITGIPPGKKYFFYVGAVYNYNEYRGFYQNQPFDYNRGSYTFFTFHEYKVTPTFTANLQAFMRTKGLQNFYELNTFGGMFVSVNKSILKRKANVILSVNDVLQTNRVSFSYNQNDQQITGKRINDTRRIGITIRYNFGFKPKEEKKNNFETPQEGKE